MVPKSIWQGLITSFEVNYRLVACIMLLFFDIATSPQQVWIVDYGLWYKIVCILIALQDLYIFISYK